MTRLFNALLGWLRKFFVFLRDEIAVWLKNTLAQFIEKYNEIQDSVIDLVSDMLVYFLQLFPSLQSNVTTSFISDVKARLYAWNELLPISEMLTLLMFFLGYEIVKTQFSLTRLLIRFVFGSRAK